jgi:hypothetical protein
MRRKRISFGIEDFLVIMAILMILSAMVVPHFAKPPKKATGNPPTHAAATVPPAR